MGVYAYSDVYTVLFVSPLLYFSSKELNCIFVFSAPKAVRCLVKQLLQRHPNDRPHVSVAATACQMMLWRPELFDSDREQNGLVKDVTRYSNNLSDICTIYNMSGRIFDATQKRMLRKACEIFLSIFQKQKHACFQQINNGYFNYFKENFDIPLMQNI